MVVTGVAIDQDVLVVGGGLAGTTAALAAARAGADTRLVSHKASTLASASGLIDVLGYTPAGDGPVVEPFAAIERLPESHPYRRAGLEALESGLSLFDGVVDGYSGAGTTRNALVPTCHGRVKPTARYPDSVAPGLIGDSRETLLVGFERLPSFDADLAAARLSETDVPGSFRGITLSFPNGMSADPKRHRFAHLLDGNEKVNGSGVRRALADAIEPHVEGARRVGLPAVLGLESPDDVRETLVSLLGVEVFEVPTDPPSIPGSRLEKQLSEALAAAGVFVETGNPVVGYEATDGTVETVLVGGTGPTVPYAAEEFVLATGGLVGKGINSDRTGVREPIFDCYVAHDGDRTAWFADEVFGDHPFASFGVAPDEKLRPRDENGCPEFDNLRAAGAVCGNYDYSAELSAGGVSLATGYRAGRLAGENG